MKYPPNMSRPIRNGAFILPSGVIRPTEIRPHSAALPRIFSMMHECTALKRHAVRAYFPLSFRTALSREGSAFLMDILGCSVTFPHQLSFYSCARWSCQG